MKNMPNTSPIEDNDNEMEYFEEDEPMITPAKNRKKGWGILGGS